MLKGQNLIDNPYNYEEWSKVTMQLKAYIRK